MNSKLREKSGICENLYTRKLPDLQYIGSTAADILESFMRVSQRYDKYFILQDLGAY